MSEPLRWTLRFKNLEKAYSQFEKGIRLPRPSELERQGIIQSFEFTFELSWKCLKDYLSAQGVECSFPRDVIKQAFKSGVIENGEIWLEMLASRNLLTHTYDERIAREAYEKIKNHFFPAIAQVFQNLKSRQIP